MMKELWDYMKSKQGTFLFAGDILMLIGVVYYKWSIMRIISFFWLDTIIMVLFLAVFLKMQFKVSVFMIVPVVFLMGSILLGLYLEIFKTCNKAGEGMAAFDYAHPFRPYYQTLGILISILCGHFFELRFFAKLINKDRRISINYFYIFVARFIGICIVMFLVAIVATINDSPGRMIVPMIALVLLKEAMEFQIFRIYRKKLTLEEENKMPMI